MEELLTLERAGWDSLCAGTGSDVYGELMTDDAVMVLAGGLVMGRAEVVASLRDAPRWDRYEIEDPRTVELAGGAVALVYTGTGWREQGEPFVGVMTSVYLPTGEGWRLALYQQTARA